MTNDNEQSEILLLADGIELGVATRTEQIKAAAELRRLHEVNVELVEALEYVIKGVPSTWSGVWKAQTALEKAKGENNG